MRPDWLHKEYVEYIENFDPTPEYLYDPPLYMPTYEEFAAEREDQKFDELCYELLLFGDVEESKIEAKVHEILDHPERYPEYF